MSLAKFIETSDWFTTFSRQYIGPYTFRTRLLWPIAWLKFMWLSRGDWL